MKFRILILMCLLTHFSSFAETTLKDLYEDDQYELIIELLNKKKSLTLEELTWLARSHGRIGEYSNGIMYSEELLRRSIEANDTFHLVQAINVKTENLVDLGRYEEGFEFCEANNQYFRDQDSAEFQLLCFKLGMIQFHLEDYEGAYDTYNEITMAKFRDISLFKTNYALALMGVGEFDEAIIYLTESAALERRDGYSASNEYSNISLVYMLQKNWDEAKLYLDSSALEIRKYPSFSGEKYIYESYYGLYSNTGEITLARRYLDSIEIINEKIFNQKLDEELVALQTSFDREHTLKKNIVTINDELAYSQKVTLWGVIIFLISLLVLGAVITFLWIRNIKTQNQNILVEQKLLRSQMTPHFMFNSLAILQGIILNKEYNKSINYLSKFSKLLRITLENSRDKIVTLENEIKAIENYIVVQNLGTEDLFKCVIDIDPTIDQKRLLVPPMMIQPFIENAIEHAFPVKQESQEISIKIKFHGENLTCSIMDNGVGLSQAKVADNREKNSLATTITSERLEMLGKEFKVKTSISIVDRKVNNESGTLVNIVLPYKQSIND